MKIFTDGGARGNPGPAASAFVVKDEAGNVQFKRGKYLGVATNNQAEYEAVVMALEWIMEQKSEKGRVIIFFMDSNLVANQLNGIFKVKDDNLRELYLKIKQLESEIEGIISYNFVRREQNVEADLLVNQTLDAN